MRLLANLSRTTLSDDRICLPCSSPCSAAKALNPLAASAPCQHLRRYSDNPDREETHLACSALHSCRSPLNKSLWPPERRSWLDGSPPSAASGPPRRLHRSSEDPFVLTGENLPHMPLPMMTTSASAGNGSSLPAFRSGWSRTERCHTDSSPSGMGRCGCSEDVAIGILLR